MNSYFNRKKQIMSENHRVGRIKGTYGVESMLEPLSPDPFFSSLEPENQPGFCQLQIHMPRRRNKILLLTWKENAYIPSAGDSGKYFARRYFYKKRMTDKLHWFQKSISITVLSYRGMCIRKKVLVKNLTIITPVNGF